MRKSNLDELPIGTFLCGALLVAGCVLFGWWSAAQASDMRPYELALMAGSVAPPAQSP